MDLLVQEEQLMHNAFFSFFFLLRCVRGGRERNLLVVTANPLTLRMALILKYLHCLCGVDTRPTIPISVSFFFLFTPYTFISMPHQRLFKSAWPLFTLCARLYGAALRPCKKARGLLFFLFPGAVDDSHARQRKTCRMRKNLF